MSRHRQHEAFAFVRLSIASHRNQVQISSALSTVSTGTSGFLISTLGRPSKVRLSIFKTKFNFGAIYTSGFQPCCRPSEVRLSSICRRNQVQLSRTSGSRISKVTGTTRAQTDLSFCEKRRKSGESKSNRLACLDFDLDDDLVLMQQKSRRNDYYTKYSRWNVPTSEIRLPQNFANKK
jgi:hypothetical protein